VDAVRIDAFVTDSKGQIVTDLTADDFELKDDGRQQKVTLATFVPVASGASSSTLSSSAQLAIGAAPGVKPLSSARPLARDEVKRSIVILVDDLGIAWESLYPTRKALHRFIDDSLQPGDLVALTRTGMSAGMQRQFTADRRLLHSAVDDLRWTALSRRWVEPFAAMEGTGLMNAGGGPGAGQTVDMAGQAALKGVKEISSALATLSAANLTLQAMRTLPGRKAVILVTEGFDMYEDKTIEPRIQAALDALWDQAARAGVVIYTIEARGLQTGMLLASDNTSKVYSPDGTEKAIRDSYALRHADLRATQDSMDLIARETGGFAVLDTNDLARGLQRIVSDLRGFYILGYTPDPESFVKKGAAIAPHRISLKVRRPGLKVRTHHSFIGRPELAAPAPTTETPQQTLLSAAMSPFATTTMSVTLTPLWGYSAKDGASVMALLSVNANDLTFVSADDGRTVATAETVGVVIDANGSVVTARNATFSIHRDATDQGSGGGVTYSLLVPVPKPGGYQMRFAVRDTHSGAVGSVGEFVEVPDVGHGAFALSSVVLWHGQQVARERPQEATSEEVGAGSARQFAAGDELVYTYEAYNVTGPVEATSSVWRDGREVFRAATDALHPVTTGPIRAAGALHLGGSLSPGSYVLQIEARTTTDKRKKTTATTRADFVVKQGGQ
jgi:VWFA-related protein